MGQTLSNGVYLPNEGERNCYAGLASNWQILNTAVGNIAEKAPLVHTHGSISNDGKVGTTANLPLITGTGGAVQAGAFGNSANTFCEGNDSRLSDARTPVAHTHTKSDVTDLLNSDFIPSANDTYDLGSSIYQWNNAYIKSLTINGIACGDILTHDVSEFVNVTGGQTIGGIKTFYTSATSYPIIKLKTAFIEQGLYDSDSSKGLAFRCVDKNDAILGDFGYKAESTGEVGSYFSARTKVNNKQTTREVKLRFKPGSTDCELVPDTTNLIDLGTSTNKWKNLNGINPGALSLPGAYQAINDQIKDPNGQLNAIDLNGGSNTWVSDVDCYLYFYIPNNKFTWIRIFWPATLVRCGQTFVPVPNESSDYSGFVPVPANTTVVIQIKGTQAPAFRRSACLGNV